MNEHKKKKPTVYADGKEYPAKPGLMDRLKEAFEPTSTRADLDAVRKRRQRYGS